MNKKLVDMTYEELVNEAMQTIHLGLLEDGSSGMRSAIWGYLDIAIRWREEKNEKENKNG